jgi:hypothetical protein
MKFPTSPKTNCGAVSLLTRGNIQMLLPLLDLIGAFS